MVRRSVACTANDPGAFLAELLRRSAAFDGPAHLWRTNASLIVHFCGLITLSKDSSASNSSFSSCTRV